MKALRTYAPLLVTLCMVLMPVLTIADVNSPQQGFVNNPQTGYVNSPAGGGNPGSVRIENPLKVTNFCDLLKTVLDAILILGMPIAVMFLVWVGFKFILARGNPSEIDKAKENFLYTVIGIAIFLGAWAIAKVIAATLGALGVGAINECVR